MTDAERQAFADMLLLCAKAVESAREIERREAMSRIEHLEKALLMRHFNQFSGADDCEGWLVSERSGNSDSAKDIF